MRLPGRAGRNYPWGAETDLYNRCNLTNTGIGHTSAVGLFPSGDTPSESGNTHGVADLAGNVWEWCRTPWCRAPWLQDYKDYEKKVSDDLEGQCARVLRGGSWNNGNCPQYWRLGRPGESATLQASMQKCSYIFSVCDGTAYVCGAASRGP